MQLNEINFSDAQPVDGYGAGFFRIGGTVFHGPVLTGALGTTAWGGSRGPPMPWGRPRPPATTGRG